jgi:hypothetical protein
LLAVILSDEAASAEHAWRRFRADQKLDTLAPGAIRLLPAVSERLHALGIEDDQLARVRGISRYLWVRSQLAVAGAKEAAALLAARGVPSLALKGLALVSASTVELARRPLLDADLCVRPTDFAAAAQVLGEAGWSISQPCPHATLFRRASAGLDLHRWPLHQDPRFDAWSHALPPAESAFHTVDATDLLLHVCVHGVRAESSALWVLDARRIVERSEIAWERLLRVARERRLGLVLEDTLVLLPSVPSDVMAALGALTVTPVEALEYRGVVGSLPGRRGHACRMAQRFLADLRRNHAVLDDDILARALRHQHYLSSADWLASARPAPSP